MSVAWSRCCHSHRRVPWPSTFFVFQTKPLLLLHPLLHGACCLATSVRVVAPPEMSLALNPGEVVHSCSAGLWTPDDQAYAWSSTGAPGRHCRQGTRKEVTPELLSGRRALRPPPWTPPPPHRARAHTQAHTLHAPSQTKDTEADR